MQVKAYRGRKAAPTCQPVLMSTKFASRSACAGAELMLRFISAASLIRRGASARPSQSSRSVELDGTTGVPL